MKNEITFVVEEAVEGGFTAHALGEAIVTEADTMAELHAMIRDAVDCHFEPNEKPKVIHLHFVRDEVIAA
jgi:glycerate-2-kinase